MAVTNQGREEPSITTEVNEQDVQEQEKACVDKLCNGWSHASRLTKREETDGSDTLTSKPLELTDWPELADHLRDYLSSYDHKMVCADSELASLDCQLAMTNLARDYFNLAIKQTESDHPSRVWRQVDTGELYGAMLVLDPAQDSDSIPQVRNGEKMLKK
ncbi:hypothetical protein AHF37_08852 [Paragonimus kellicotti]|nr:hypothetical protein AHF37_08852 [Paragonimus kellicotti]